MLEPRTKNSRIASIYNLAVTHDCCWSTTQLRVNGSYDRHSNITKFSIGITGVENSGRFIMVLHAIGRIRAPDAAKNSPYNRLRMRRGSLTCTLHCIPVTLKEPYSVFSAYSGTGYGVALRIGRELCIHAPRNDQESERHATGSPSSPQEWRYLTRNADRNLGGIESFDAETGVLVVCWGVSGSRVYTFV